MPHKFFYDAGNLCLDNLFMMLCVELLRDESGIVQLVKLFLDKNIAL